MTNRRQWVRGEARLAVVALTLCAPAAVAEPVASVEAPRRTTVEPRSSPVEPPVPSGDHSAREVESAPLPGDESGRIDRVDPGDSAFRVAARGALFVPKLAVKIIGAPIRATLWADDRYALTDRYYRWFYNDARTIGLVPIASYDSGAGVLVGARFVDHDLAGDHETLELHASTGWSFHQDHALAVRTGQRLGRLELGLDANFGRRPNDRFDGIGNGDLGTATMPIDPRFDATAVHTSYRLQEERAAIQGDTRVASNLHVVARGTVADLQLGRSSSGPAIDDVYDRAGLVGFARGVRHADAELEVRWDSRGRANEFEPRDLHGQGSLASVSGARVTNLHGGGDFWRYGAELQHYLRLGQGPRVLALRVRGDAVTAPRDQVPFVELPTLGGDNFLRGYNFERFRDRVATFASAQYEWDLSHNSAAYLFVDAGRVMPGIADLTLDHLRVGYGIGLELHDNAGGFVVEGAIASSIDGGIILSASLNPVLDARPRWR